MIGFRQNCLKMPSDYGELLKGPALSALVARQFVQQHVHFFIFVDPNAIVEHSGVASQLPDSSIYSEEFIANGVVRRLEISKASVFIKVDEKFSRFLCQPNIKLADALDFVENLRNIVALRCFNTVEHKDTLQIFFNCLETLPEELLDQLRAEREAGRDVVAIRYVAE